MIPDVLPKRLPAYLAVSHHTNTTTAPDKLFRPIMAPSTRLRSQPSRRINYAASTGSRGNRILLEETPERGPVAEQVNSPPSNRKSAHMPVARIKAGDVVKAKAEVKVKKAGKAAANLKTKTPYAKFECSICATTKSKLRSFKIPEDAETCAHFKSICGSCIQKLVKTKIADRQLAEHDVGCAFPGCKHMLDLATVKVAVRKSAFENYEEALTKHRLSADPHFITCLSTKCGKYFSIEDCKGKSKRNTEQKVACPYCEYELCLTCNRPWHVFSDCSKAKMKEDEDSMKEIQAMGAKQCPKCGVNIEKRGGCDHMTCNRCRHNFCWQCLVPYTSNVVHGEGCPHGVRNVAADLGNWAADNLTLAQINNLIAQSQRRLDDPQPQVPVQAANAWPHFGVGAPTIIAPAQNPPHPAPDPAQPFVLGTATLFQLLWGGGDNGGG